MCPNNGPKYYLLGLYNFQTFVSQQGRKKEGGKIKVNCILEEKY